jgi:very-short-patch-repair endonuclease
MVREARHDPTPAEKLLWQKLRRKQLGVHFRRQHPIYVSYADFCCPSADLIVELDDPIHNQQAERDFERTEILEALGYRVLRFTNLDLFRNPSAVVERIRDAVNSVSPRICT